MLHTHHAPQNHTTVALSDLGCAAAVQHNQHENRPTAHLVLSHCLLECVVVTGVVCQLALCQPDDVCAHTVQEILTASRHNTAQHAGMSVTVASSQHTTHHCKMVNNACATAQHPARNHASCRQEQPCCIKSAHVHPRETSARHLMQHVGLQESTAAACGCTCAYIPNTCSVEYI